MKGFKIRLKSMFYEIDISSLSRTHKFELEFFFQVDILLILGGFQKNVSIFLDLLDPFPLVSNFIVYNLEILLSYVSILRTSLLPLGCWCHLWKPPNKLWGKQCDFSKWHFFTDFSPTVSIYITAQTVLYSFFYLMRALENCGTTSITVSSLE